MDLYNIIDTYNYEIIIGLSVSIIILFILNTIGHFKVKSITKNYNKLVNGVKGTNLEEMILKHLDNAKDINNKINYVEKDIKSINSRLKSTIQKVGMVRYNAFDDMGSDLSYSIALLDENDNGCVLSSLYGRNDSSTYGKPVINGKSSYELSIEEIQAIDKAKKQENSQLAC